MKFLLSILFLLISCLPAISQVKGETSANKQFKNSGNTYAVIVGIANYENKNIPNLNFPGKDAAVFAEYLQSKAGGSVPAENIRLLIDTNATTAAIYNALNWLREKCESDKYEHKDKENQVYFYFSGHGDLETDTKANLGFLLSYNTPRNNYINNAVRLEDLNIYANTLSLDFNANVILITDACHSGKLAGSDNRGTYLVGKELSTVRAKEIRIAACAPDQLSQENEGWGGGRGIFSYYLINGLKGLADRNKDSIVTLNEIQQYLDSSISNDRIMKENRLVQTPVIKGDTKFRLSLIDTTILLTLQRIISSFLSAQTNQDYFFSLLKQRDMLESLDFIKLNSLRKEEIPFAFIDQLLKKEDTTIRRDKVVQLKKTLQVNKEELKLFTEILVDVLHTSGQEIINLYLQGDAAELERRRYYNSKSSGYDMYPVLYSVALKLTAPDNPLTQILKVNQYYFAGVAARLKIPTVEEPKQRQLIEEALASQKKALALEKNAAYIYNELGIVSQAKKEYTAAEENYIKATELAADWAIPRANLSGLYAVTKKFEKAIKEGQTADDLQPGLQSTNANFGFIYESTDNWLFAEEFYRKAIDINSRHYYPFERLGYVYMNTTQYALADSFFHEAEIRKKGYHFNGDGFAMSYIMSPPPPMPFSPCLLDTAVLKNDDIMAFFYWGHTEYLEKNYTNAVRIFKKIIAVDKTNPLVFHYMGKIFYDQQKWEDAEIMFKLAASYYLDTVAFRRYCDSVIQHSKFTYPHDCFEKYFWEHQYIQIEDYYFLATLYESWAHYEEAEEAYRTIINMSPDNIGGYVKLWRMLEKLGRYTEAEKIIQSYIPWDQEAATRELNEFYRRTIEQFPEDGTWPYKLGLLLYERAAMPAYSSYIDTIVYFPLLNKEVFLDVDLHNSLSRNPNMLVAGKTANESPQRIKVDVLLEKHDGIMLPGIAEYLTLAHSIIYIPRKEAIRFLLKADSLLTETEVKADINFKVGNVYVWAGSKKKAWPYYAKSVQLGPDNASARLSLIDVSKALYKNRAALEQLNYLYDKQQINFPNRLLLAEFSIHSGQFEKGKKLLDEAEAIHPYVVPEIADLKGRMYLLSQKPAQGISFYKNFLAIHPSDCNTFYTLAKLYAQTGNKGEAWKWLKEAMKKGFNYSYILNSDVTWNDFRKTQQWNSLIKQFPMKKYIDPVLP
jgi:tetratricopeptide (TPR) repeat protein